MAAMLIALYRKPEDAATFDAHYESTHAPLAKKMPGLRGYQISVGEVATPQGPSPLHLAALLSFDSVEAIGQALASPEGQATAKDLGNFAQAGVELLMFETREA